jgi:predicted transcriptional regulator
VVIMFPTGTFIFEQPYYFYRCYSLLPELSEISRKRKQIGLTQRELAKLAGVSRSWVAKVEKYPERLKPSYSATKNVFDVLETQLKYRTGKMKTRKSLTVEEIHNKPIIYAVVTETLREARIRMEENYFSQFPVKDEKGDICGSLTERDIIRTRIARIKANQLDSSQIKVKEAMGDPFPMVSVGTPVYAIVDLLQNNQAVLTLKGQKAMGIVTRIDLAKILEQT